MCDTSKHIIEVVGSLQIRTQRYLVAKQQSAVIYKIFFDIYNYHIST